MLLVCSFIGLMYFPLLINGIDAENSAKPLNLRQKRQNVGSNENLRVLKNVQYQWEGRNLILSWDLNDSTPILKYEITITNIQTKDIAYKGIPKHVRSQQSYRCPIPEIPYAPFYEVNIQANNVVPLKLFVKSENLKKPHINCEDNTCTIYIEAENNVTKISHIYLVVTNLSSKEDQSYRLDKNSHVHKLVSFKDPTNTQWIAKQLIFRNNEIIEYKYSFGRQNLKGFERIDLKEGYLYNVTAIAITYYCPTCADVTMGSTIVNLEPVSVLAYVFGSLVPFVLIICAIAFGVFYYKRIKDGQHPGQHPIQTRKLPDEPSRRRKNTYSYAPGPPDNIYEPIGYGAAGGYDVVINPPLGKIEMYQMALNSRAADENDYMKMNKTQEVHHRRKSSSGKQEDAYMKMTRSAGDEVHVYENTQEQPPLTEGSYMAMNKARTSL